MKKDISFYGFCDEFEKMGRGYQFSFEGKKALYEYLEEMNPDYTLDIIGLCCSFTEYESLKDLKKDYDLQDITDINDLENADIFGVIIKFEGGLLVEN